MYQPGYAPETCEDALRAIHYYETAIRVLEARAVKTKPFTTEFDAAVTDLFTAREEHKRLNVVYTTLYFKPINDVLALRGQRWE